MKSKNYLNNIYLLNPIEQIWLNKIMKKDTIAIIQARMGSNRLPRKMTKKLGKYRIIEWVIKRLKKSKKIDYIVLATTKKKNDNILITFAKKYNIEYFRGSEINVLIDFIKFQRIIIAIV